MSDFPFFPLYVSDLLGDDKVIAMDLTEFGAYVRLLCLAWQQKPPASIPSDDAVIAKMLGVTADAWADLKPAVIPCWQLRGGRLHNKRLGRVYAEMTEKRRKRQEAGRLGGKQCSSNAQAPPEQSGYGSGSESSVSENGADPPPRKPCPWKPSEWEAAIKSLQCLPSEAQACWAFYDTQNWDKITAKGHRVPISGDPRSLLTSWLANPRRTEGQSAQQPKQEVKPCLE